MAASSSYMAFAKFSMLGWLGGSRELKMRRVTSVSAQQQAEVQESQEVNAREEEKVKQPVQPRPVEPQVNVKSKNMGREYGGQWLSSVTRHVRIYAAYIDPETCEFDQTQTDKLTLILDPTDEFVWTDETCYKVYSYFQELVDHYEVMDTWLSYAPVKNNPEDAAKTHYEVFNGQEVEVWPRIVWKPKWGLTFAEIRSKVSGSCSITQRSTMAIKGRNIFVKDLSLDGALVIDSIDEAEKKEAPTMLDWCANNHTKYWGAAETEHLQRYFST